MGIAPSVPSTPEDGSCDAVVPRGFEFFESLDPGRAFRWAALVQARGRRGARALARCADYAFVYSAWISMERREGGGDPAAARVLFEEWRARSEADGDGGSEEGRALLWTRYISFELEDGGTERARAVAAAALAACPRNADVRAEYVLAEVKLGDDERARAAFERALADLAAEAEAARQLTEKVRRRGAYLSEQWFGGCLSFCRGWWFRPQRWWEQI